MTKLVIEKLKDCRFSITTVRRWQRTPIPGKCPWNFLRGVRLGKNAVEVLHLSGRRQLVKIERIRNPSLVAKGNGRRLLRCDCGRRAKTMYLYNGWLVCKHCTNAIYTTSRLSPTQRLLVRIARIKFQLQHGLMHNPKRQRLRELLRIAQHKLQAMPRSDKARMSKHVLDSLNHGAPLNWHD